MMKRFFSLTAVVFSVVFTLNAAILVDVPLNSVSVQNLQGDAQFIADKLFGEPGQPLLPVYTCDILLPPDADLGTVTFSVVGLKEDIVLSTFNVQPALPPATAEGLDWPLDRNIVEGKDMDVYLKDAVFPAENTFSEDLGQMNCYKILSVRANLVRYNPVTKTLYKLTGGKIAVDYSKIPGYRSSKNSAIIIPESLKQRAQRLCVNYNEFAANYEADFNFTKAEKMALITTKAIQSGAKSFQKFLDSKKARGVDVQVVTEDVWGSGATGIRTWLQNNYQTGGFKYVLLIGTSNGDVPMMTFTGYARGQRADCPSEWPFAQLTGDYKADKKTEVSVGRIPVYNNDLTTVDAILDKIVLYENATTGAIEWRKMALLGAGGYDASTKADNTLNQLHKNVIVPNTPWKDYRVYGTNYGTPTVEDATNTKTGISPAIFTAQWKESKPGIVSWGTHGSSGSAQYVFGSGNAAEIGNTNPSYVLCGSCSNATITSATNLSYSILKGCGMGAIGGTNLTYYSPGQSSFDANGSDQGWMYTFVRFIVKDKMNFGETITALRDMDPGYGWYNRGPYVAYGDPSVGVYTCNTNISVSPKNITGSEKFYSIHTANSMNFFFTPAVKNNTTLLVYDLSGSVVKELTASPGKNSITWSLTNKTGSKVGAGIYLVKLLKNGENGSQVTLTTKVAVK